MIESIRGTNLLSLDELSRAAIVEVLDAAESFLRSEFAASAFGSDVLKHYHALADYEWHAFMRSVTDWERERYLDSI